MKRIYCDFIKAGDEIRVGGDWLTVDEVRSAAPTSRGGERRPWLICGEREFVAEPSTVRLVRRSADTSQGEAA